MCTAAGKCGDGECYGGHCVCGANGYGADCATGSKPSQKKNKNQNGLSFWLKWNNFVTVRAQKINWFQNSHMIRALRSGWTETL